MPLILRVLEWGFQLGISQFCTNLGLNCLFVIIIGAFCFVFSPVDKTGGQDNLLGGQFWAMGRFNILGGQTRWANTHTVNMLITPPPHPHPDFSYIRLLLKVLLTRMISKLNYKCPGRVSLKGASHDFLYQISLFFPHLLIVLHI